MTTDSPYRVGMVDLPALETKGDVAVLRYVPLGDVHPRHDLDTTDEGWLQVLWRRQLLDKHTVDSILDLELALEGFDVHIRGA
jgi:hypothetical protein